MIAKHEIRTYQSEAKVFLGHYLNPISIPHWHYDWELVYIEEGTLEAILGEHLYVVSPHQAILIPSGIEHSLLPRTKTESYILIFSNELVSSMDPFAHFKTPLLKGNYDFDGLFNSIKEELTDKKPFYPYILDSEIQSFFAGILRNEDLSGASLENMEVSSFMKLIEDIDDNYADYTAKRAAEFLSMSPSYFSKYFHRVSGIVFAKYLNSVRVEKAVGLLQSEKGIKLSDCASRCGFDTIRNFNRVFKSLTGYAPSELPPSYKFSANSIYYGDSASFFGERFNPTWEGTVLKESWD